MNGQVPKSQYLLSLSSLLFFLTCSSEAHKPDTTPPTVTIQSPISGQTVGELVTIIGAADDNKGVESVEFFIDDLSLMADSIEPFEAIWNTADYANGQHSIAAIATDVSGIFTLAKPILVTVNNFEK